MPSGAALDDEIAAILARERPSYVAVACKWWNTLYGALEVADAVRRAALRSRSSSVGPRVRFSRELVATGKVDVVLGDADFSVHALVREGRVSNGDSGGRISP